MISLPASPLANSQSPRENLLGAALPNIIPPSYTGYIQPSESYLPKAYGVNVFELAHGIRISWLMHIYVNLMELHLIRNIIGSMIIF